jgi:hypothetical protein
MKEILIPVLVVVAVFVAIIVVALGVNSNTQANACNNASITIPNVEARLIGDGILRNCYIGIPYAGKTLWIAYNYFIGAGLPGGEK